jgi:hypothetical protein
MSRREVQKGRKIEGFSVISCGDAAAVLEPTESALHDIAFSVGAARVTTESGARRDGRDAGFCTCGFNGGNDGFAVIPFIGDDVFLQ